MYLYWNRGITLFDNWVLIWAVLTRKSYMTSYRRCSQEWRFKRRSITTRKPDAQKIVHCIINNILICYKCLDSVNSDYYLSSSDFNEDSPGLPPLLLRQMTNNKAKVTGIVVSLILALAIVIIIIVKAVVPGSDGGLELSLFGDLFG